MPHDILLPLLPSQHSDVGNFHLPADMRVKAHF